MSSVTVHEIKWLLPALKSLCEGKSSGNTPEDISGGIALNAAGAVSGTAPTSNNGTASNSVTLSTTGTGGNVNTTGSNLVAGANLKCPAVFSSHGGHTQNDNVSTYFNSNNVSSVRACGGGNTNRVLTNSLQFDYNAVYAALKSSKYPESKFSGNVICSNNASGTNATATGPLVSPPSSSSSTSTSLSTAAATSHANASVDRDSSKADIKRSRSDLSSIIIHQLTNPLEVGKIAWTPFSEELTDCSVRINTLY